MSKAIEWKEKTEAEWTRKLVVDERICMLCPADYRDATPADLRAACEAVGFHVASAEENRERVEQARMAHSVASNVHEFAIHTIDPDSRDAVVSWGRVVGEFEKVRAEASRLEDALATEKARADQAEAAYADKARELRTEREEMGVKMLRLHNEADDLRARAEKAEAELVAVNGRLAGERDTVNALRTKLAAAEEHSAPMRVAIQNLSEHCADLVSRAQAAEARLAALTAPVEGEPTDEELRLAYANGPRLADAIRALYRLGVQHERARHQRTEPRATEEELFQAFDKGRADCESGCGVDADRAGILAVAAKVRAEQCLVTRAVAKGEGLSVVPGSQGRWYVTVKMSERNCAPSDVAATLAAMLGEVGA